MGIVEKIKAVKSSSEMKMLKSCRRQIKKFSDTDARDYVLKLLLDREREMIKQAYKEE